MEFKIPIKVAFVCGNCKAEMMITWNAERQTPPDICPFCGSKYLLTEDD